MNLLDESQDMKEDIFEEAEEGKLDILNLEIHKEEKDTKPPMSIRKTVLIFGIITIGIAGLAVGIGKIIDVVSENPFYNFAGILSVMFLIAGAFAIFAMGIAGFWGGQST